MMCWPYSVIVTFTAKLFIQGVVFIVFLTEVKTETLKWKVTMDVKVTYIQKCKQGVIVGFDEIELRGVVELKPEFLPQFKQMEVEMEVTEPLCTMWLESGDKCVSQLHGMYNCSCSKGAPPKYNVFFRSTIEETMTRQAENLEFFLRSFYIKVMDKNNYYLTQSNVNDGRKLIQIDNIKSNLLNCSVTSEVGSVHGFMFCTEHLYLPNITMSPQADETNGSCASKNIEVQFGETRLRMSYEDQCQRKNTYTCFITGFSQETVSSRFPTAEGETRPSHTTRTKEPSNITEGAPPVLIRTSQSIMFSVVTFLVLCVTSLAVIAFLLYTTFRKGDDDDPDYYSSSSESSNS